MKLITYTTTVIAMTAAAFAGTSPVIASAPSSAPTLAGWFFGGSYGQLEASHNAESFISEFTQGNVDANVGDIDLDVYTLHFGRDLGTQVMGCDVAAYVEVGYLSGEQTAYFSNQGPGPSNSYDFEVVIVPITLNLKLERPIYGSVNGYLTGGLGYAFNNLEVSGEQSLGDGGFYAQASAGLLYNVNAQLEVFAGGRWSHLSSLEFDNNVGIELDDKFSWEVGARYNF
jgi:opacity protein-like surface antigen